MEKEESGKTVARLTFFWERLQSVQKKIFFSKGSRFKDSLEV